MESEICFGSFGFGEVGAELPPAGRVDSNFLSGSIDFLRHGPGLQGGLGQVGTDMSLSDVLLPAYIKNISPPVTGRYQETCVKYLRGVLASLSCLMTTCNS